MKIKARFDLVAVSAENSSTLRSSLSAASRPTRSRSGWSGSGSRGSNSGSAGSNPISAGSSSTGSNSISARSSPAGRKSTSMPMSQTFEVQFREASGNKNSVKFSGNPGYVVGQPIRAGKQPDDQSTRKQSDFPFLFLCLLGAGR